MQEASPVIRRPETGQARDSRTEVFSRPTVALEKYRRATGAKFQAARTSGWQAGRYAALSTKYGKFPPYRYEHICRGFGAVNRQILPGQQD
jgi:hypothetical protein